MQAEEKLIAEKKRLDAIKKIEGMNEDELRQHHADVLVTVQEMAAWVVTFTAAARVNAAVISDLQGRMEVLQAMIEERLVKDNGGSIH